MNSRAAQVAHVIDGCPLHTFSGCSSIRLYLLLLLQSVSRRLGSLMALSNAPVQTPYLLLMYSFMIPPLPHFFKYSKYIGDIKTPFACNMLQSKCEFTFGQSGIEKKYLPLLSDFIQLIFKLQKYKREAN